MQRPQVIVVIGGLISSTFLTLFAIPVFYGWFVKGAWPLFFISPLDISLANKDNSHRSIIEHAWSSTFD